MIVLLMTLMTLLVMAPFVLIVGLIIKYEYSKNSLKKLHNPRVLKYKMLLSYSKIMGDKEAYAVATCNLEYLRPIIEDEYVPN